MILVQAADSLAETEYLLDQAGTHPDWVRGVVGWLPLRDTEQVADLIEQGWTERLCGIRHLTHDDADPEFLRDGMVQRSLALVAGAGLVLDVPDAYPAQLSQVPEVAAAVPDLAIVVDHLGKPPLGGDLDRWRMELRALGPIEQVCAKVSGLATSGVADVRPEDLRPIWEEALEVLGPGRLMFGSDWPIADPPGDYGAGTAAVLDLIAELSLTERRQMLAGTAERVYGVAGP